MFWDNDKGSGSQNQRRAQLARYWTSKVSGALGDELEGLITGWMEKDKVRIE